MEGAPDIFDTNQAVDVNAWTATNSTIAVASSKLTITNSGAASGYADLSLTGLIVGSSYRLTYGYEVGTSTSATFSVISDSVAIATDTQTVTGTYTLDFTATQENADFRAENVSTTASHTTLVTAANYVDKSAGDFAGIYLDDTTMQWLNIVSITGNVLYLNGGLTSATAIGNYVYTYSDKIQRPLRVQDQRYQVNIIQDEIPVQKMSRKDYLNQTDKSTAGTVSQAYYNPKLVNGQLSVWQTSDSNLSLLRFSYNNPLEIFDTNQNTPNFPSEWYLPCAYNLAAIIAPEYKASESNQMILEKKASQFLQDALAFDDEMVSMFVQPDDS